MAGGSKRDATPPPQRRSQPIPAQPARPSQAIAAQPQPPARASRPIAAQEAARAQPMTPSGAVPAIADAELFPSLQRLAQTRKGKVPFVQQTEWTDCGPACVAMVLKFLGRDVRLEEVREAT